jgi:pyruvate dehydrogenase phosphatase
MARNHTPPYLSNQADVRHVDLKRMHITKRFLIMCSDGLVDLYMKDGTKAAPLEVLADRWVSIAGSRTGDENKALRLLRDALGSDQDNVSRMLMRESTQRWMDDTTILVQKL